MASRARWRCCARVASWKRNGTQLRLLQGEGEVPNGLRAEPGGLSAAGDSVSSISRNSEESRQSPQPHPIPHQASPSFGWKDPAGCCLIDEMHKFHAEFQPPAAHRLPNRPPHPEPITCLRSGVPVSSGAER
eukprot:Skav203195  [mRNA]  locus=scaffold2115:64424:76820:+ [translate_table: standard]